MLIADFTKNVCVEEKYEFLCTWPYKTTNINIVKRITLIFAQCFMCESIAKSFSQLKESHLWYMCVKVNITFSCNIIILL